MLLLYLTATLVPEMLLNSDKTSNVHLIKCKKRFLLLKVTTFKETLTL